MSKMFGQRVAMEFMLDLGIHNIIELGIHNTIAI